MIKKWLKNRKQKARDQEQQNGYKFAAIILLKQLPGGVSQIRSNIDCARHFGDYDEFEMGMNDAINDAIKLGIAKEDDHD